MAYPQEGAKYKHEPHWLDKIKSEESVVTTPYKQSDFVAKHVTPAKDTEDN